LHLLYFKKQDKKRNPKKTGETTAATFCTRVRAVRTHNLVKLEKKLRNRF
jgi:hypothetical protein